MSENKKLAVASHQEEPDLRGSLGTAVVQKPKIRLQEPSLYKVLLHNDDYTPMDFVVHILETIFNKDREQATKIMLDVHKKGVGICGTYPYDIAQTKIAFVIEKSREYEYPLKCTLEK